jgi:hypothetical protein
MGCICFSVAVVAAVAILYEIRQIVQKPFGGKIRHVAVSYDK